MLRPTGRSNEVFMAEITTCKTCCPNCGTISIVNVEDVEENWLPCILPTGFEWNLPAGKLTPAAGPAIYVSAFGEHLSREAYMAKYNIDPEVAYKNMRATIRSPKPTPVGAGAGTPGNKPAPKRLGKY